MVKVEGYINNYGNTSNLGKVTAEDVNNLIQGKPSMIKLQGVESVKSDRNDVSIVFKTNKGYLKIDVTDKLTWKTFRSQIAMQNNELISSGTLANENNSAVKWLCHRLDMACGKAINPSIFGDKEHKMLEASRLMAKNYLGINVADTVSPGEALAVAVPAVVGGVMFAAGAATVNPLLMFGGSAVMGSMSVFHPAAEAADLTSQRDAIETKITAQDETIGAYNKYYQVQKKSIEAGKKAYQDGKNELLRQLNETLRDIKDPVVRSRIINASLEAYTSGVHTVAGSLSNNRTDQEKRTKEYYNNAGKKVYETDRREVLNTLQNKFRDIKDTALREKAINTGIASFNAGVSLALRPMFGGHAEK